MNDTAPEAPAPTPASQHLTAPDIDRADALRYANTQSYLHADRLYGRDPNRPGIERSDLWQRAADRWPDVAARRLAMAVPPVRTNGTTAEVLQLGIEVTLRALQHPTLDCARCGHRSDCALHNGPALPIGPCDCGWHPELVLR